MTYYYVVRSNSPTAKTTTWKVLSRRFREKKKAEDHADFERKLKINKRYEVFVISRDEPGNEFEITNDEVEMLKTTLKESGHWYIVGVHPAWLHPNNTVDNCLAITFDGSITLKCETLPDGKLKVAQLPHHNEFFHTDKMGLEVGQVLTVLELCHLIWDHPFHLRLDGRIVNRTNKKPHFLCS